MGKAKTSRKGKKAWRKNISSEAHEELVEQSTKEARVGGPLDQLPDDALFFVDKEKDLAVERKVNKVRNKGPLHCESILARSSLVAPVRWSTRKKAAENKAAPQKLTGSAVSIKKESKTKGEKRVLDIWDDASAQPSKKAAKRPQSIAPAVEVDLPGCSYNPDTEDHQDALAKAVADEMQKQYAKAVEPTPPQRASNGAQDWDEEERFFLEADEAAGTSEAEDEQDAEEAQVSTSRRADASGKLTRVDLNRRMRRLKQEAEEAKRKELKKLRTDLERLEQIMGDVEAEQREKEMRLLRKKIAAAERAAAAPPRLGKHKFKPEPVHVLLSDELTGSLRNMKAYPALAKDRFKSLQRRGLIEPRVPSKGRKSNVRRVTYEQGSKGAKEREMHAEMLARKALREQGREFEEVL
ncbi:nucleolar protein 53 [Klebsormidium nitens]|uniref:Ribosome biogenesis protein NOP53 n=1 Tax=Klebsormidium nitens TaxID=105231 RepID=A0A1Y1I8Y5_KLENI|nr:nucleolar protein 53 [Klebsormidium nitens]|eukprot:GAQ87400.1 nucleolar protein 53 [Klebsormidium nitens]